MELFYETVGNCFDSTLRGMGASIRDWVYEYLEKRGIHGPEIPARFEDVIAILMERLGGSARVIAYRTMVELCREFGLTYNLSLQDPFRERFVVLKDRVLADRLVAKRRQVLPAIRLG